jgi:dienelactone hydrolase
VPPEATGDRSPRFYFMAGERDRAAPAETLHLAAEDYAAAGFPSKARIYPKVAHRFPIHRDDELRTALDFVLER